jgi:hypothetical protein
VYYHTKGTISGNPLPIEPAFGVPAKLLPQRPAWASVPTDPTEQKLNRTEPIYKATVWPMLYFHGGPSCNLVLTPRISGVQLPGSPLDLSVVRELNLACFAGLQLVGQGCACSAVKSRVASAAVPAALQQHSHTASKTQQQYRSVTAAMAPWVGRRRNGCMGLLGKGGAQRVCSRWSAPIPLCCGKALRGQSMCMLIAHSPKLKAAVAVLLLPGVPQIMPHAHNAVLPCCACVLIAAGACLWWGVES